jgi:hypothetical protein
MSHVYFNLVSSKKSCEIKSDSGLGINFSSERKRNMLETVLNSNSL